MKPTKGQREQLLNIWAECDEDDKSTEYMFQIMVDSTGLDYDDVVQFVMKTSSKERINHAKGYDYEEEQVDIPKEVHRNIILEFKTRFDKALEAKTGWGKNEVKELHSRIIIEVFTELL